jgi:hypothetical protein
VTQHLVVAGLLHVQNFALERQNRLEAAIAALLGSSACRFTLDEIELAAVWLAFAAIGELAGQSTAIKGALAAGKVTGLACGLTRAGCPWSGLRTGAARVSH